MGIESPTNILKTGYEPYWPNRTYRSAAYWSGTPYNSHCAVDFARIKLYISSVYNPTTYVKVYITNIVPDEPESTFWNHLDRIPYSTSLFVSQTGWTGEMPLDYLDRFEGLDKLVIAFTGDESPGNQRFSIITNFELYMHYYVLPNAPRNFTATTDGYLQWDYPVGPDWDGFHIQLSTDPQFSSYLQFAVNKWATSYELHGLQENTHYYVRIAGYRQGQTHQYDGDFAYADFWTPAFWYYIQFNGEPLSTGIMGPERNIHFWWHWRTNIIPTQYGSIDSSAVTDYGLFDEIYSDYEPKQWYHANPREGYTYATMPYHCWLGGYHPDFINNFTFSNHITVYPGGGADPVVTTCADTLCLYPSWSPKIAVDSLKNIHIVYTSGDSIYYIFSEDKGHTFSNPEPIAQGKFPALSISNLGLEVVFLRDNKICYTRKTENWSSPILIYENPAITELQPPAFAVDKDNNLAYLAWDTQFRDSAVVNTATMNLIAPESVIVRHIDQSLTIQDFASPSISIRRDGTPLVVWSKQGRVYLNDGTETKLIETGDGYAINPMVTAVGDNIKLIWQTNNDAGLKQINYTEKTWWGWINPVVLDEGDLASHPIITGTGHIIYGESENGKSYLRYLGISEDSWHLHTMMVVYSDGIIKDVNACNFVSWPDNPVYSIFFLPQQDEIKLATVSGADIPITYLNCGNGKSPYTIASYRNWHYTNLPVHTVDVDSQRLDYHFTNLNPVKRYRIKITAFQDEQEEIRQWVKIDGKKIGQFKVPRKEIAEFEKWLAPDCYTDGEIYLRLEKKNGFTTASGIFIMEYNQEMEDRIAKQSNLQSYSENQTASNISVIPNPTTNIANITFNLNIPEKVVLAIYDNSGRLVKNLIGGNLKAGKHSVLWNGTDNNGNSVSSGVYFLIIKSEENSEIHKIILVR